MNIKTISGPSLIAKRRLKAFSLTLILLIIITGCTSPENKELVLDESANGKTIKIKAKEKFLVKLSSNPTTGFKWEWKPNDTEIITLLETKYEPSEDAEEKVGAGGTEIFIFRASKHEIDEIELVYRRAWENDVPPAKTVRFVVDAR